MATENLSPEILETADFFDGLHINDFVLGALQRGVVDAINAGRMLAISKTLHLDKPVTNQLSTIAKQHDGEPIPGRIIAPLLRVSQDFAEQETVWIQPAHKAKWMEQPVYAIDELTDKIVVEIDSKKRAEVDASDIGLFTDTDYHLLLKPNNRRPHKQGVALRFALGMSAFDGAYSQTQHLSATFRHFDLNNKVKPFMPTAD
jgi:hypothetical protein